MNPVLAAGVLLVALGLLLIGFSVVQAKGPARAEAKAGGIIMIGPIPIAFGTDEQALFLAVVLGIAVVALAVALLLWPGFR